MKKFALLATGLLISGSLFANAAISTVAPTLVQHQACLKDIKTALDAANVTAKTTSTAPSNLLLKLNTISNCQVPGLLVPMPTAAELKAAAATAEAAKKAATPTLTRPVAPVPVAPKVGPGVTLAPTNPPIAPTIPVSVQH